MNRREHERDRRPAKRSRSPDERGRSPREDKRRRPHERERERERDRDRDREREPPTSPRATRHSARLNGRDSRYHREDENRREQERDSRPRSYRGSTTPLYWPSFSSNRQDEQSRNDRDKRPVNLSKLEPEKSRTDAKLLTFQQPSLTEPRAPAKPQSITANSLLDELEDNEPSLSTILGFSRFNTTKGKKHVDYGGVQLIKQRKYRQYMNRPGGFNRPIDQA